jgi:hypothetical protein
MLKFMIAAVVVGTASLAPAFADEMMPCDEASMTKVNQMIDAGTDPAMKPKVDAAKAEMQMAAKAANATECATHLNKAAAAITAK